MSKTVLTIDLRHDSARAGGNFEAHPTILQFDNAPFTFLRRPEI
jgi:hypothetical protein